MICVGRAGERTKLYEIAGRRSDRRCTRRNGHQIESDARRPGSGHAEDGRCLARQVDFTALHVGAVIVDSHLDRSSVIKVGHHHVAPEGVEGRGGRQVVLVVDLTTRGRVAVEPRAVPRGDAQLRIWRRGDRGYRGDNWWGRGRERSSCRTSGEHQARDAQSNCTTKVATCFPYFHHHIQSARNYRRPGVGR
jgi:hypothetical protein